MPFRAILFDIGDTLWHSKAAPPADEFRRLATERSQQFLTTLGITSADPELAARAAWDAMEAAMRTARQTDQVEPDYAAVSQHALVKIGVLLSREAAGAFLEAIYVSGIEGGKEAYPESAFALSELRKRGFQLATVTNRAIGGDRFRSDMRDAGLDIGWDLEAVSVEVGYLKPHRAIFEYALAGLGIEAGEALMVGNSLAEDIAGAQRMGIATAWRKSPPDAEGVTPDYAFDDLYELLAEPELQRASHVD